MPDGGPSAGDGAANSDNNSGADSSATSGSGRLRCQHFSACKKGSSMTFNRQRSNTATAGSAKELCLQLSGMMYEGALVASNQFLPSVAYCIL